MHRDLCLIPGSRSFDAVLLSANARARSQRSSFLARLRERHSLKSNGRNGLSRCAFKRVEVGSRGISKAYEGTVEDGLSLVCMCV